MPAAPYIAPIPTEMPRTSMTVSQVCTILAASRSEVYRLIHSGALEAYRLGTKSIRVPADAVTDFQSRQRVTPIGERVRPAAKHDSRQGASTASYRAAMIEAKRLGIWLG